MVLGCARSGTSMLTGVLADSGYDPGNVLPPSLLKPSALASNPKGYFEDARTVNINDRLLQALWPSAETIVGNTPLPRSVWMPGRGPIKEIKGQRILDRDLINISELFLSILPVNQYIRDPKGLHDVLRDDMKAALSSRQAEARPFVRKDPRFCYTLDAWRTAIDDNVAFICIFRSPGASANSVLKHVEDEPLWRDVGLSYQGAVKLWEQSYSHVLQRHRLSGDWVFVHYDQILDGSALPAIERHLDIATPISSAFIEPSLRRSADGPVSSAANSLYDELCDLALYPREKRPAEPLQRFTLS
jgi:hypothetical protein